MSVKSEIASVLQNHFLIQDSDSYTVKGILIKLKECFTEDGRELCEMDMRVFDRKDFSAKLTVDRLTDDDIKTIIECMPRLNLDTYTDKFKELAKKYEGRFTCEIDSFSAFDDTKDVVYCCMDDFKTDNHAEMLTFGYQMRLTIKDCGFFVRADPDILMDEELMALNPIELKKKMIDLCSTPYSNAYLEFTKKDGLDIVNVRSMQDGSITINGLDGTITIKDQEKTQKQVLEEIIRRANSLKAHGGINNITDLESSDIERLFEKHSDGFDIHGTYSIQGHDVTILRLGNDLHELIIDGENSKWTIHMTVKNFFEEDMTVLKECLAADVDDKGNDWWRTIHTEGESNNKYIKKLEKIIERDGGYLEYRRDASRYHEDDLFFDDHDGTFYRMDYKTGVKMLEHDNHYVTVFIDDTLRAYPLTLDHIDDYSLAYLEKDELKDKLIELSCLEKEFLFHIGDDKTGVTIKPTGVPSALVSEYEKTVNSSKNPVIKLSSGNGKQMDIIIDNGQEIEKVLDDTISRFALENAIGLTPLASGTEFPVQRTDFTSGTVKLFEILEGHFIMEPQPNGDTLITIDTDYEKTKYLVPDIAPQSFADLAVQSNVYKPTGFFKDKMVEFIEQNGGKLINEEIKHIDDGKGL